MTDLLTVLPEFDAETHHQVLAALEKALISTADLIFLHPAEVAKRAGVTANDVVNISETIIDRLHEGIGINDGTQIAHRNGYISLLDHALDEALGGGLPTGTVVEFVGESAAGKTQFLLSMLLSVQLPAPQGLGKSALYISTEAPLQTIRLMQILDNHPALSNLSSDERPSLRRIHSIHIHDLEAQEHILRYQVPVAVARHNIGLIVIDSIAANYRPEFGRSGAGARNGAESFAKRSNQLTQIGALLRNMAYQHNLVVVVANQVADRFLSNDPVSGTQQTQVSNGNPDSTQNVAKIEDASNIAMPPFHDDPLSLDHQQNFFTGWGDDRSMSNLKTPSLGLTWANQLSARFALLKEPVFDAKAPPAGEDRNIAGWRRTLKVVTSSWCLQSQIPFEIVSAGVRGVIETVEGSEKTAGVLPDRSTSLL